MLGGFPLTITSDPDPENQVTQTNIREPMASDGTNAHFSALSDRVVLSDPRLLPDPSEPVFSLGYWRARAAVTGTAPGRGSVWFVRSGDEEWALRHYRRGGMVGRLIEDHYLWTGQSQVRAIAEWRLLARMYDAGLPVPGPVAAAYVREGLFYTCDLITRRLADTTTLGKLLSNGEIEDSVWQQVGRVVRKFHAFGIDHADLNAHNILVNTRGQIYLIDFDRGRQRPPGRWQARNLARLLRSLRKICPESNRQWVTRGWTAIQDGYWAQREEES